MIKDELFILSATGCPGCEAIKNKVKGKIAVYDIAKSDDAYEVAQKIGIRAIPTAVEKDGENYAPCKMRLTANKLVIECRNKNIEIEGES